MTVDEEYEELNDLLFKREQEYGDSDVIMIAGLLSGRTGEVHRSYVYEKLHAVHHKNTTGLHNTRSLLERCLKYITPLSGDDMGGDGAADPLLHEELKEALFPSAPDIICPECGRPQIEHKAGMLDSFGMRRVRRALQEHADNPVMFLAEISKNSWT